MKETTYKLEIKFIEPLLGSQPTLDVASEFIAKKNGFGELPEDEAGTLSEKLERGTTVFHKDDAGNPLIWNYQVKGFLKNSAQVQNGKVSGGIKALRSKVNNLVFISPRQIPIKVPNGYDIDYLERPLRAETAQGPRVALARSEMLPEGCTISCGVTVLGDVIDEDVLRELFDYGYYQGMGQWRNGGWGSFTYKLTLEI